MLVRGINHVVLKVRDLEASDAFYSGLLGLRKVGHRGRMWFYSAGAHHHDLALVEVGSGARPPAPASTGLFHLCFDVPDEASLAVLYERCRQAGATILGSVDHNIQRSFYVRDPDGHTIELGVDVPLEQWKLGDPFAEDSPYEIPASGRR
jgi:catechol 2,3-dioxygenase